MEHKAAAQENQITEGIIWKQILLFFFPILFGTFFQQLYNAAAETLDEVLELFPYVREGERALLRTYNRDYTVEPDALHYKFDLQVWVKRQNPLWPDEPAPYMQHLAQNMDVFEMEI